jgi:transcriptional regulator with XRE-family HTH domain
MSEKLINKNIRYLRKQNKLSQEKLAEKLKVTRGMIMQYEAKSQPSLQTLQKMVDLFEVPMVDLINTDLELKDQILDETDTAEDVIVKIARSRINDSRIVNIDVNDIDQLRNRVEELELENKYLKGLLKIYMK